MFWGIAHRLETRFIALTGLGFLLSYMFNLRLFWRSELPLIISGSAFAFVAITVTFTLYVRMREIRIRSEYDAENLLTFLHHAEMLAKESDKKWLDLQREIVEGYVSKIINFPERPYTETEVEFDELMENLNKIKYRSEKDNETYSYMLATLSNISSVREELVQRLEGHSRIGEIITLPFGISFMAVLLVSRAPDLLSLVFTGMASALVLNLIVSIMELASLKFGDSYVFVKPYQKVLDDLELSRREENI